MIKEYLERKRFLNQKLAEHDLLLTGYDIIEEYETLINLLDGNDSKKIGKTLKNIDELIKYEDALISYIGNVGVDKYVSVTDDDVNYDRLEFKVLYNYKMVNGSNELLIHNFVIKTLKDLYEMFLNEPSKEENPGYYNNLLKEYKRMVIKYMTCNPDFELNMIKNNLDITKISCELPEIDSKFAMSIIEKNMRNVSNQTINNEAQFEVINAFNQKLFENVYPYLSDEIKASFENGSSYGR